MPADTRLVSITATGPDGIVVELQLTGRAGCSPGVLRGRLDAAVRQVVHAFVSGMPVEVAVGGPDIQTSPAWPRTWIQPRSTNSST